MPAPFATALLLVGTLVAGCGTSASPSPTATSAAGGGCVAAPAPPDKQVGWTSASTEPSLFPVIVNSSGGLTCGSNRLLFTILDADNRDVASPDRTASIALFNRGRDGANPTESVDGMFVWGIENERGFYIAEVDFPEAGEWGAEFTTSLSDAAPEKIRMTFQVATSSPVVRVGEPAPASDTPVATTTGDLARISSDPSPDPDFYRISVKDALAAHDPMVVVFATPRFCVSAQCGPTLDRVKAIADAYPTVTFINIEPYVLAYTDGSLQPVLDTSVDPPELKPTQATLDWGLLSEPWVFVVDRNGIVTGSFEGVIADSELKAAITAVM